MLWVLVVLGAVWLVVQLHETEEFMKVFGDNLTILASWYLFIVLSLIMVGVCMRSIVCVVCFP